MHCTTPFSHRCKLCCLQSREEDTDRDGRNDVLHLQVDMPLDDLEEVIGVQLILIFDYRFYVSQAQTVC